MLKQELHQKLLQKLSPQQIQFIQLLQLNTSEISGRVLEELEENPALEKDDIETAEKSEIDSEAEKETESESEEDWLDKDIDVSDYMSREERDNFSSHYDPNDADKEIPIPHVDTLYDSLTEQLRSVELSEKEELLAKHLIGMIEGDGYLRRPLKSIAYDLAFLNSIRVTEQELSNVLKILQDFDPPGIAARDLQECLLIQLRRKKNRSESVKLAEKIIRKHMDDLAHKHYDKLKKQLKIDTNQLREAMDTIQLLNPKPGGSQDDTKHQYIIPDFLVKNVDGDLNVSLNSRNAPELNVNRQYQRTLEGYMNSDKKDKKLKEKVQFIKQRLDNAKWFIDAIKQRQQTLLYTMRTIVEFQKDYFLTGDFNKLKPMILKDVAEEIELDISTVSRVVSSKYVQTDYGIFSLKEFFSESIKTKDGREVSNIQVKNLLKDLIEKEDKNQPYTDDKITEMLTDRGYDIARRTVAKYREQLNIPVARLRKELN